MYSNTLQSLTDNTVSRKQFTTSTNHLQLMEANTEGSTRKSLSSSDEEFDVETVETTIGSKVGKPPDDHAVIPIPSTSPLTHASKTTAQNHKNGKFICFYVL